MKLNRKNFDYYQLTETDEAKLWDECIFIFDTSTLLDFYFFSTETLDDIFENIFEKNQGRLWIPQHVEFEYLKNRVVTLTKPINSKYVPLQLELKSVNDLLNKMQNKIKELEDSTKDKTLHPYLGDDSTILTMKEKHKQYREEVSLNTKTISEDLGKRIDEINSYTINDKVLENFEKYLNVGREYNFDEIMKIAEEGEKRFIANIPPGYKDAKGPKPKDGIQRYGDLINWFQIIEIAKNQSKPIVFVINDNKEDWCIKDEKDKNRIEKPKFELIKEIKDKAQVRMWMYNLPQFLYKSEKLLKSPIKQTSINEALNVHSLEEDEDMIFEMQQFIQDYIIRIVKLNEDILVLVDDNNLEFKNSKIAKKLQKKVEDKIIQIQGYFRNIAGLKEYYTYTHIIILGKSISNLTEIFDVDKDRQKLLSFLLNMNENESEKLAAENALDLFKDIYKEIYQKL